MTVDPIVFVARNPAAWASWSGALRSAMPDETVLDAASLTPAQRDAVRLAIVADPDPVVLAALPSLEWVHSVWAGVERMVAELPETLPVVRLVDPALADTMSEAVLTAVLWQHRNGPAYRAAQDRAAWSPQPLVTAGERRVAVLGLGALGRAAARRLVRNGFAVSGWSRGAKPLDGVRTHNGPDGLRACLEDADIVVSLLPLTKETDGLFNDATFGTMKPGAAFVNFGRGGSVDEAALLRALDGGTLSHALLDVFAEEPLPPGHPFWARADITVWPHVSAPTNRETAAAIVAANVAGWRSTGQLPPTVDRSRGY